MVSAVKNKTDKNVSDMMNYAAYEELTSNNNPSGGGGCSGCSGFPIIQLGMIVIVGILAPVLTVIGLYELATGKITLSEFWEKYNMFVGISVIMLHSCAVILWLIWFREKILGKKLEKISGSNLVSKHPVVVYSSAAAFLRSWYME